MYLACTVLFNTVPVIYIYIYLQSTLQYFVLICLIDYNLHSSVFIYIYIYLQRNLQYFVLTGHSQHSDVKYFYIVSDCYCLYLLYTLPFVLAGRYCKRNPFRIM